MTARSRLPIAEVGTQKATFAIVPIPTTEARKLLPRGMKLATQSITPARTHPLLCMFGKQCDVRTVFPVFDGSHTRQVIDVLHDYRKYLHHHGVLPGELPEESPAALPALFPLPFNYLEVISVLPCVDWVDPKHKCPGPFVYSPRLYLNSFFPTVGGWLLGLAKRLADMTMVGQTLEARRRRATVLYFRGTSTPRGPASPPSSFPNFKNVEPIFRQPIMGHVAAGVFLRTRMDFDFGAATMRAAPAKMRVPRPFFDPNLPGRTLTAKGIDQDPIGSFWIEVDWKLHDPQLCSVLGRLELRQTLEKLKRLERQ